MTPPAAPGTTRTVACWAALGALLGVTLGACGRRGSTADSTGSAMDVRVALVAPQPFSLTVGAIGRVAGRPGHVTTLSALAPSRINRVLVAIGQRVGAGAPLVELDPAPFVTATRAADAALVGAERSFERTRRLVEGGILPRKDLDVATTELERTRADAAAARRLQGLSVLRSPIGGVVTRLGAVLGATADPSQVLVEVADPGALDILFTLGPREAARVRPGAKVTLRDGEGTTSESLGTATVIDVGGIVDSASLGVTIRAQAPATRRPLRLGETVFGDIITTVHPRAIVIPPEALVPDGEGFKVFVVDATGVAHTRAVTVGGRAENGVEIIAGLAAGERIVIYGAYGIEDSTRIAPLLRPSAGTSPRP